MRYIKEYYERDEYLDLFNYWFKIFIGDNFLNLSKSEVERLFKIGVNEIIDDVLEGNIRSDKKLFMSIRELILSVAFSNNKDNLLFNAIVNHGGYDLEVKFKSDDYLTYDKKYFNRDFLLLMFKEEYL